MYKKIMLPVDLAHVETLKRAIEVASDLAAHYEAELCVVGITSNVPGSIARTPEEYRQKLEDFAAERRGDNNHPVSAHVEISHDPSTELNDGLLRAREAVGADLVVMATHVPNVGDILVPAHGGSFASHSEVSVFLVRAS